MKPLPNATASERSILAAVMHQPENAFQRIGADRLEDGHFHHPAHNLLFKLFLDARQENNPGRCKIRELTEELDQRGRLEDVGGHSGLASISNAWEGTAASWPLWVRRLKEARLRRITKAHGLKLDVIADDGEATPEDIHLKTQEALEEVRASLTSNSRNLSADESAAAFLRRLEELSENGCRPGLSTGINCLDQATGGPRKGQLWTIAARTSRGKSVALLQLAGEAVRNGKRAMVFSLEMEADEVFARISAGTFGASFSACSNPAGATKGELEGIRRAVEELRGSGLVINDAPDMSADKIAVEAERVQSAEGLDLIVVDYLQLLGGERKRNERQDEEISRNVVRLKQLAKKLKVPVLTASQLNDTGQLFASRAIGHHSDVVLVVQDDGVKVDKQRNGPRGVVLPLTMNGALQRFEEER